MSEYVKHNQDRKILEGSVESDNENVPEEPLSFPPVIKNYSITSEHEYMMMNFTDTLILADEVVVSSENPTNDVDSKITIRKVSQESDVRKLSIVDQRRSVQMDMFMDNFVKPEFSSLESGVSTYSSIGKEMISRVARKQIVFNLLVIGDEGLGKRTFVESLIAKNLRVPSSPEPTMENPTRAMDNPVITERLVDLVCNKQKILLKLIEIPNYNRSLQSDQTFQPLLDYVDSTFEECFRMECAINRKSLVDRKIHCCIYFVSPYGHGLRPVDIEFLRIFQSKLNILLVIPKSDLFTPTELQRFRAQILADMERSGIDLFGFMRDCSLEEDEDYENLHAISEEIKINMPFAIVSSLSNKDRGQTPLRSYPWGELKAHDPSLSSFLKLEEILLQSHTSYFRKMTKNVHYEKFRVNYILQRVQ